MRNLYYDRDGSPLTLEQWGKKLNNLAYKRVASDTVGPLWVSTIWLGLEHGFCADRPLIFETMGFSADRGSPKAWLELLGPWRYATEQDALRAHALIVDKLRQMFERPGLTPGDVRALLVDFDLGEST
jgi:hypothetical protein